MRVYPPPPARDLEKDEEEAQQRRLSQFEDDFDDLSSVGTSRTAQSSRSARSAGGGAGSELGTSNINRIRSMQRMRRIKNVYEDLDTQMYSGYVEANVYLLNQDEMIKLFTKVPLKVDKLDALRITCIPKEFDIPMDKQNDKKQTVPAYRYGKKPHRLLARDMADVLLGDLLRTKFSRMVEVVMHPCQELKHLELGVGMSDAGLTVLSNLLLKAEHLERFSLCGSCIGDHGLALLKDGLNGNKTMKELDLSGCAITDKGAKVVATIIKEHATARNNHFWKEMLREYPHDNEGKMRQRIYERTKAQIISRVSAQEGGLLLLELRENKIDDEGMSLLFDAMVFDTRILLLGLRRNKIGTHWQETFATLIKEHPSLQQVDLRGNKSVYLGILRKRSHGDEVMLHLPQSKRSGKLDRWKGLEIAETRMPDTFMLKLDDVLESPRDDNGSEEEPASPPPQSPKLSPPPGTAAELMGLQATADRINSKSGSAGQVKQETKSRAGSAPRRRTKGTNQQVSSASGATQGRDGRTLKKGNRLRKQNPKADEGEMVEHMSGVLLQLHGLVSQFEVAAQKDPQMMARLTNSLDDLHTIKAPRASSQTLTGGLLGQITEQLKQFCHLDDTAASREADPHH